MGLIPGGKLELRLIKQLPHQYIIDGFIKWLSFIFVIRLYTPPLLDKYLPKKNTHNTPPSPSTSPPLHLQNLLQLLLLLPRQRPRELDIIPDHEIPPPAPLLRHPQIRIRIVAPRLRGPALVDDEVLAIDGRDGAFPPRQSLLEVQLEGEHDVVALAREEGVFFLRGRWLAWCLLLEQR